MVDRKFMTSNFLQVSVFLLSNCYCTLHVPWKACHTFRIPKPMHFFGKLTNTAMDWTSIFLLQAVEYYDRLLGKMHDVHRHRSKHLRKKFCHLESHHKSQFSIAGWSKFDMHLIRPSSNLPLRCGVHTVCTDRNSTIALFLTCPIVISELRLIVYIHYCIGQKPKFCYPNTHNKNIPT